MTNAEKLKKFFLKHRENLMILSIFFFNIFSLFLACEFDKVMQLSRGNIVSVKSFRYWTWFFSWWSAWNSLFTLLWVIWKLFFFKKESAGFRSQVIDLIITQSNFISFLVYCAGGFILTMPDKRNSLIKFVNFEVKPLDAWLFYNLFWHIISPILSIYYFIFFSDIDKILENKKKSLTLSIFFPTIYFIFVITRPEFFNLGREINKKPHIYPSNYPYPFFFWLMGKKHSSSWRCKKFSIDFFNHSAPRRLFWFILVIFGFHLTFSKMTFFLVYLKLKIEKSRQRKKESII